MKRTVTVIPDAFTEAAAKAFDYPFVGESSFIVPDFTPPADWGLGLLVGPSGSGKSTILEQHFPKPVPLQWNPEQAVISHFDDPDSAIVRMSAVGFNSIPAWCRPRHVLSNGEGHRVDLARGLVDNAVVDEFTSVVNREAAKSTAVGVRRLVDRLNLRRVVLATCHYDVVPWLQPDWTFDTATGVTTLRGALQRRPLIELDIVSTSTAVWPMFAAHHYLNETLHRNANCWLALWGGVPVAFASSIPFPHGAIKQGYRETRTVCLPDYQGFGIGTRLSDAIADLHVLAGKRYFSRTAHPRMGQYRDASPLWKPTSTNHKAMHAEGKEKSKLNGHGWKIETTRVCYSHEYVGVNGLL